jgi:hypothetical protein
MKLACLGEASSWSQGEWKGCHEISRLSVDGPVDTNRLRIKILCCPAQQRRQFAHVSIHLDNVCILLDVARKVQAKQTTKHIVVTEQ